MIMQQITIQKLVELFKNQPSKVVQQALPFLVPKESSP